MAVKRAALYIRVSTDEQARHGLSLGEQRADLLKYAESHGYPIVDIYADEGASARKAIKKRKELQRLLADVAAGRIDVIIIKCLDRWSRNIADFYETQKFLEAHNVVWECSQEKYNTATASGRFYMNIRMSVAQDESDRTSERIKYVFAGKKERKEALSGGNLPFGLSAVNKRPVPDENAKIVRFLFDYVAGGGSARSSLRAIYDKFGVKLSYRQIYVILRHRAYIGELYKIPDYCPAIVPYDLFMQVQTLIKKNKKCAPSGRIYLFTGLIRCPDCGRVLAGSCGSRNVHGEHKSFQYKCDSRARNAGLDRCHFSRSLFENTIERKLIDSLQGILKQHIYRIELSRRKQQEEKNLETELSLVKEKLLRLKDIYLDGMIDKEMYEKDYVKLKSQAAELSVLIDKLPPKRPALWKKIEATGFKETYYSLSRENRRKFWQSLVSRITFEDTPESRGQNGVFNFHIEFL